MKFLTPDVIMSSLGEVGSTVVFIAIAVAILEILVYFAWQPLGRLAQQIDRALQPLGAAARHAISAVLLVGVLWFAVVANSVGQTSSPWLFLWPAALLAFVVGVFISPIAITVFSDEFRLPYMLLAPAVVGLIMLVVYPLLWEVNVSLTNLSPKHFKSPDFVGLANYVAVFTHPILKQVYFFPVFLRTVLWTVVNVTFHVGGGMVLAMLLNRDLRFKGVYRTILVLPWAIPQVIACLAWRGEFNFEFGFPNLVLQQIGFNPIRWLTEPTPNFIGMLIVNIWLGIPFMMVTILGGLQSISGEYYEAAEIDGASGWQQFRYITLPLLQPVLTPVIILGTIWTFNNFNVPFFINQYELETSDILVTALFRSAFQYFNLGDAAAFSFVLFGILLIFSVVYIRVTGGLKGVYD